MTGLVTDIKARARVIKNTLGEDVMTVSDKVIIDIAEKNGLKIRDVGLQCLEQGIVPLRYLRNGPAIGIADQIILARSQVAVVGAGGLGGHVILNLARLGIGKLLVFDPDTFDETNLNRQALCNSYNLGVFKAEEAALQCAQINPLLEVSAHVTRVSHPGQNHFFTGTHVVVDALDNGKDRLTLSAMAGDMGIPLVHGTVAGFEGRVMTVHPGETGMESLYHHDPEENCAGSAESLLGTSALAPALTAAFQVMAVLKILLKRESMPSNSFLHLDLDKAAVHKFFL